jgi:hypothetical protein
MAGCSNSSSSAPGTLGVSLTDSPACGFDHVYVTVSKVRVHQSSTASDQDSGWSDITLNPAEKIDLLDLTNGVLIPLGQTPLAAGHYTQLRLVLASGAFANSVVPSGTTTEIELKTPSATQSGLKLINEFDVPSGQRVDLLLDFDACKSVVLRGNGTYLLKPVIKVIPFVLNYIEGFVNTSLTGSNVVVSAQSNGEIVRSTAPNPLTGEFFLAHLPAPAFYDVVITADGHATAVIAGVPVSSATSTVSVSTQAQPIDLPPSTTRTISGMVTLQPPSTDIVATVTSMQTVTTGLTVTVKSQAVQAVDLISSPTYTLTLPVDAPLLGHYGTGIPPAIVFTPQSAAAGKYNVEASAPGYLSSPSAPIDISSSDQTQPFILTP